MQPVAILDGSSTADVQHPLLSEWCLAALGASAAAVHPLSTRQTAVFLVVLQDGRKVVVKVRDDELNRVRSCLVVQDSLVRTGFPCARPLTTVERLGDRVVHAEEWLPGGGIKAGADPGAARLAARLLADLVRRAAQVAVPAPLPDPIWVRWNHEDGEVWPAHPWHDARAARRAVSPDVVRVATRVRHRLRATSLPRVLGHADWEAHNLRWLGDTPYAVHDWDSIAWLPEAALAGLACGGFASVGQPSLAPIESSAAFLEAYGDERGLALSSEERQVAWAASLWLAAHNARMETLCVKPPVATEALGLQAADRLRLAGA